MNEPMVLRAWCALWLSTALHAQAPATLQFEVASVKPSGPLQRAYPARLINGGPGSTSPGQITYHEHSLRDLIFMAYRVQVFQLSTPAWIDSSYFEIVARVPAGATRDDLRPMLQHLLRERFGLQLHTEKRQLAGYVLALGPGDHKMKTSPPASPQGDSRLPPQLAIDNDGFIIPPGDAPNIFYLPPQAGVAHLTANRASVSMFCSYVARLLQRPIVDETGLQGALDFRLKFAPETAAAAEPVGDAADPFSEPLASDPAPTLPRAVASQLGLRLTAKRVAVDIFVIDHCERTPVEN